ncbi:hypothetical protein ABE322_20880 [Priestia megaterium]
MSDNHYFKKIIKDNSQNKDKQKYYDDKEENEMGYKNKKHDDDCCHDKKHKHDDDCCHDKEHKEEKSIFTEFDVSENTALVFTPTTGSTATPINSRAQVKIDVDDTDDQVLLQGTVEWTPEPISILAVILLAVLGLVAVPLGIVGTFRIWRSCDHGPLVPIFQTRDTSIISELDLVGIGTGVGTLSLPFSTVTTSFHWVDKNPCCGINHYYLTLDIALTTDPLVPGGATPITTATLLSDLLGPLDFNTGTVVFTATEIENNKC